MPVVATTARPFLYKLTHIVVHYHSEMEELTEQSTP